MTARARLGVAAFCLAILGGGIAEGDLFRNEGLRARLAQELFAGAAWFVPTLYGQVHLTKPPGMSILIALTSLPFGEITAVSARLPSVVAGFAAIFLVGWTVGRCSGSKAGWFAAAMLPVCPLWLDRVPSAEIDLIQLAWVTGALLFFFRAWECPASESSAWPWWMLAFACVLGGFFTKWTGPAFFYCTLLVFLALKGQLRLLISLPHLVGLGLAAFLSLLWLGLLIQEAGVLAVRETLSREALLRLSPGHHPRPYPWVELATFPLSFLAGCLPWTLLALPALLPSFRGSWNERENDLRLLALAWAGVNLLFWTVVPGHRPRHILPAQPAVVLLAALTVSAWLDRRPGWSVLGRSPIPWVVGSLGLWLLVKIVWVGVVLPARQDGRDLRRQGESLARLVPQESLLQLGRIKDEGLLFYYGRQARRSTWPPPDSGRGSWWLLTEEEGETRPKRAKVVHRLRDGQGQTLLLVQLLNSPAPSMDKDPSCQIAETSLKE